MAGGPSGRTQAQIEKSYRKRFGVDWPCAIRELELLGLRFGPEWVTQVHRTLQGAQQARNKQQESIRSQAEEAFPDSNEWFAYIAGYTPGGTPFGVTWEE